MYQMRPMITQVKKKNIDKNGLVGVEIGVKLGNHAKIILKNLPIKKLYLIEGDKCQKMLLMKKLH